MYNVYQINGVAYYYDAGYNPKPNVYDKKIEVDSIPKLKVGEKLKIDINNQLIVVPSSDEVLLRIAKQEKISKIRLYDSSPNVNAFTLNGNGGLWLSKFDRMLLARRLEQDESDGKQNTILWIKGIRVELPVPQAKYMLSLLESYAIACYDTTKSHEANTYKKTTIKEVDNYENEVGYPEKIIFNT